MITGSATAEREALSQKRQELMRRKIAVARHVPYHPGCADLEVWLAKEINSLDAVLAADTAEGVPMTDAELDSIQHELFDAYMETAVPLIKPDPVQSLARHILALITEVRRLRALRTLEPYAARQQGREEGLEEAAKVAERGPTGSAIAADIRALAAKVP